MRRITWIAIAAALTLTVAGIAVASERDQPRTEPVAATLQAERTRVDERTCTGTDGTYRVARERFVGTSTSSDARLTGKLVVRTQTFVNQTTGYGVARGALVIRDPATDEPKAKGHLLAVVSAGGTWNGTIVGKVRGAGRLVANFSGTSAGGTLAAELGAGTGQNSAVVVRRACGRG